MNIFSDNYFVYGLKRFFLEYRIGYLSSKSTKLGEKSSNKLRYTDDKNLSVSELKEKRKNEKIDKKINNIHEKLNKLKLVKVTGNVSWKEFCNRMKAIYSRITKHYDDADAALTIALKNKNVNKYPFWHPYLEEKTILTKDGMVSDSGKFTAWMQKISLKSQKNKEKKLINMMKLKRKQNIDLVNERDRINKLTNKG